MAGLGLVLGLAPETAHTHDEMMPTHATRRAAADLEVSFVGTQYHALLCHETNLKTLGQRRLKLGLVLKEKRRNQMCSLKIPAQNVSSGQP